MGKTRVIEMPASVRCAIRTFEKFKSGGLGRQKDVDGWNEVNVNADYDAIILPTMKGRYQIGDERTIIFLAEGTRTPFAKVVLRLTREYGWEAYEIQYRPVKSSREESEIKSDEWLRVSDHRCSPVVDYFQFAEDWNRITFSPTIKQRLPV
ncbi:MAG: hypothetical protein M1355_02860 [Patescibacteria group bacterium]|nr:hypothetical protein [Patescibacteria group bacterium]